MVFALLQVASIHIEGNRRIGMPHTRGNLYGNAPDRAPAALLLIDVINDLDFPEADQLLEHALPMAEQISRLKVRMKRAGLPVVYANDNFGRWRSDFRSLVDHCSQGGARGRAIAKTLKPEHDDYFVLKPKHSGFYSTPLEVLLDHLQVETLVVSGIATNMCVLFTASDAFLRGYRLFVPRDCVAANTLAASDAALAQMQEVLKADARESSQLDVDQWMATSGDRVATHRAPKKRQSQRATGRT